MRTHLFKLILSMCFVGVSWAGDPILTIETQSEKRTFSTLDLSKRKDVETIFVKNDPAYVDQERKYLAVPAARLFEGVNIPDNAVIQFKALDGFSAPLSKERLLNKSPKGAIAYVAFEMTSAKWPPLKRGKPSAGPFYLIWKNPELSQISTEEWPYMLGSFEVKDTLEKVYPKIFPKTKLAKDDPVLSGLNVFVKNCFACHTLNKNGLSQVGPDLNFPMSPTEYMLEKPLKQLIRNPQSLRFWPNNKMVGFDVEAISDRELDQLLSYLRYMAKTRE